MDYTYSYNTGASVAGTSFTVAATFGDFSDPNVIYDVPGLINDEEGIRVILPAGSGSADASWEMGAFPEIEGYQVCEADWSVNGSTAAFVNISRSGTVNDSAGNTLVGGSFDLLEISAGTVDVTWANQPSAGINAGVQFGGLGIGSSASRGTASVCFCNTAPEPSSAMLIGLAGLLAFGARRSRR